MNPVSDGGTPASTISPDCSLCSQPALVYWQKQGSVSLCESCARDVLPRILADAATAPNRTQQDARALWSHAQSLFWQDCSQRGVDPNAHQPLAPIMEMLKVPRHITCPVCKGDECSIGGLSKNGTDTTIDLKCAAGHVFEITLGQVENRVRVCINRQ
jgi:hypothetical protein